MQKNTTKQFFVKRLYNGFIFTEDDKETAVENEMSLQEIFVRKMSFLHFIINSPTTLNFKLTISLEQNIPEQPSLKIND